MGSERGTVLEFVDVHAGYGRAEVLHGVSLVVREGEVVSLVGANGAGKTTTLRVASGLLRCATGQVRFFGKDVSNERPESLVSMGICQVPEGRRVFAEMTVRENLLMGAYSTRRRLLSRRGGGQAVLPSREELLNRVHELFPVLSDREKQVAGTLSGGEQQMLAIGRTLMSQPKIVMLDEPSLGLSPALTDVIFDIVVEISGTGVPILVVEQNAERSLAISDRGYVLEAGTITQHGPGAELLQSEGVRRAYLGI